MGAIQIMPPLTAINNEWRPPEQDGAVEQFEGVAVEGVDEELPADEPFPEPEPMVTQ